MSEVAVTLSPQTYEMIQRLAQITQQSIDQVINDLAIQPTKYIVSRPGVQGCSFSSSVFMSITPILVARRRPTVPACARPMDRVE